MKFRPRPTNYICRNITLISIYVNYMQRNQYLLCSSSQFIMYINHQYNTIVRAYFVEAYYNPVWDWWFVNCCMTQISLGKCLALWSVLRISLSWSVSCNSDHITSLKPLSNDWLIKIIWICIKFRFVPLLSHVLSKVTRPKYDVATGNVIKSLICRSCDVEITTLM